MLEECQNEQIAPSWRWKGGYFTLKIRELDSMTTNEVWSGRRRCILHIRVFKCITYIMMSDEKTDKLNANATKCLFLDYFESIEPIKYCGRKLKNH